MKDDKQIAFIKHLDIQEDVILGHIAELNKDLESVRRLRERALYDFDSVNIISSELIEALDKPIEDPEYDKNWTWEEKVWYMINKLGEGFTKDVADNIKKRDPAVYRDQCLSRSTGLLSHFYRHGKLNVEKHGKKYKYFIKKGAAEIPAQ